MKKFTKLLLALGVIACFAFAKTSITSTKETVKIVIDAGHGGKDAGQNIEGIKEKEVVYQITQKIKELHQNKNVELYFSRPNNEFVSLEQRVSLYMLMVIRKMKQKKEWRFTFQKKISFLKKILNMEVSFLVFLYSLLLNK